MLRRLTAPGVLLLAAAALAPPAMAADPPSQLRFLTPMDSKNGVSIVLNNVSYTDKTPGKLAGTGTLAITIGGQPLTVAGQAVPSIPNVPFQGVAADAAGKATGLSYTFANDASITDLFGSGLGFTIGKRTTISVQTAGTATLSGGSLSVTLPFRGDGGKQFGVTLQPTLSFTEDGECDLEAHNAQLMGMGNGLTVAGATLNAASVDLVYKHHKSKADDWSFSVNNASLAVNLPGMTSQDNAPLKLSVKGPLTIDQDGQVTFTEADMDDQNGLEIPLAQPMGFALKVYHASMSMANSQPGDFDLKADLTLPPDFKDDKGNAATIKGIEIKYSKNGTPPNQTVVTVTGGLDAYWNAFGIHVAPGSFIVDLSSAPFPGDQDEKGLDNNQLPPTWQGVYVKDATLYLPDGFSDQTTPSGKAQIEVQKFYINEHGVSGKVDIRPADPTKGPLANLKVMGFQAGLTELGLTLNRNTVRDCNIKGSISIPGYGGNAGLNVGISTAGIVSVDVDTSQPIQMTSIGAELTLTNGSLQIHQPDMNTRLLLTGTLAFKGDSAPSALKGAALDFKDVGVGSDGHIYVDSLWMQLPHPAHIGIGPVALEASKIGFGQITDSGDAYYKDHQNQYWVGITGDVSLSGDLPITGQVSFDGLRIFVPDSSHQLGLEVGNIAVDTDVQNVIHIAGSLKRKDPNTGKPYSISLPNGKSLDYVKGDAEISLSCLGAGGLGGRIAFEVANGAWFLMGGITIPSPGITLGQSGLSLYGFAGGIGHNVKPDHEGATGVPSIDYQLMPDVDAIEAGGLGTYVFVAGLRAGSTAPDTVWGDLVLTLYLPNVDIDLNGKCYLVSDPGSKPMPQDPTQEDRVLAGDLHFDLPQNTFTASLTADLNFPTRKQALVHADGGILLNVAPDPPAGTGKYFHIGGPISRDPIAIANPCEIKFASLAPIQGALDVDLIPTGNKSVPYKLQVQAALIFDQPIPHTSGSFGPVSYDVDGSAHVQGYLDMNIIPDPTGLTINGNGNFQVDGSLSVSGGVDLGWAGQYGASVQLAVSGQIGGSIQCSPSTTPTIDVSGDVTATATLSFPVIGDKSFNVSGHVEKKCSI